MSMSWLTKWWQQTHGTGDAEVPLELAALEERIGYTFRNRSLLVRALKHRSYVDHASETRSPGPDDQANERLEFLGDAVLGLVTTHFLYRHYPDRPEGDLTKRKSVLVSKSALARRAKAIGLDRCLLLSELEENAGGRKRRSILGDGFEALLGAMFLDGGLEPASAFLHRELFQYADELLHDATFINYKSLLLEHVQGQGDPPPEYELCRQTGPDHLRVFTVNAIVNDQVVGHGEGPSKKDAQQIAAKRAYERLTGETFDEDGTGDG